jgi:hypothetical protein
VLELEIRLMPSVSHRSSSTMDLSAVRLLSQGFPDFEGHGGAKRHDG